MISQPSKPTSFFDVMDLADLQGQFVYNFYETDEYIRVDPSYPDDAKQNLKKIPRYVKLTWQYRNQKIPTLRVGNLITSNSSLINDESSVVSPNEVKLQIHDTGLASRMISTLLTSIIIQMRPSDIKNYSTMQLVRGITGDLDPRIQAEWESYFNVYKNFEVETEKISFNLSKEYASIIIANSIIDPLCPFTLELQTAQSQIAQSLQSLDPRPQFGDYLPNLKNISVSQQIASNFTDADYTQLFHVGFKIMRSEKNVNNSSKAQKVFYISSYDETTYLDFDIRYGSTYTYSISPIFLFSYGEPVTRIKRFALISATPGTPLVIRAIDATKPDCPFDIHYFWDFTNKNLFFCWSYPPDHKNRIAKVQILRRASIDEPFTLLKEYDFDKTTRIDNPFIDIAQANSYEKTNDKVGIFYDRSFNINSKYIYALCLVDVHGNSSNLSSQFEITFDRFKSNINQRLISRFGSMKQYPNMMLESDLFIDLLKDSNHSSVELYFNPEVKRILFGSNTQSIKSEPAFLTNSQGNYKILTINTDLQKSMITTVQIR